MTLNAAQAVYVGDTQAVAVYLGDMLVWPTAPTPSGRAAVLDESGNVVRA